MFALYTYEQAIFTGNILLLINETMKIKKKINRWLIISVSYSKH